MYISKTLGLIPRITLKLFVPILKSTSTRHPLILTEFNNCGLLQPRKGLPNNPKHNASRMVDLPDPFSPIISVVEFRSNCISVN